MSSSEGRRMRVIDFETTGIPPDAEVVEAAYLDVMPSPTLGPGLTVLYGIEEPGWSSLVVPNMAIPAEARAVHHIPDREIESLGIAWPDVMKFIVHEGLYVAHSADFEKGFFNPEGSRWIDTYKCALRLWPEAPRYGNQVLRYWLENCDPGGLGMPPHRALPDCYVTAFILLNCMMRKNVEQLLAWSDEPPLLPKVPMGKHRGKKWSEVPRDYLEWATKQDFDEGVAYAVKLELARRRKS